MGVSVSYYLQALFALIILFFLLFFVLKFSKTLQKRKYSGDIKVLDRLPVDNGVTLLLVELKGQEYFLSVGGKDVRVIEKT